MGCYNNSLSMLSELGSFYKNDLMETPTCMTFRTDDRNAT